MKLNPCKKCGAPAALHEYPGVGTFEACCDVCDNETQEWRATPEESVRDWNDANPMSPATICPQCGATNRPVDWEEALDILRSAMQRKLTER
jgi:hypothetical protein